MLRVVDQGRAPIEIRRKTSASSGFDAVAIRKALMQRWHVIALSVASAVLIAFIYLIVARPLFTAKSEVMIDTRKNQLFQSQQVVGEQQIDAGMVESQVEVLKSEGVALSVIRDLNLSDDAAFMNSGGSFVGSLLRFIFGGDVKTISQQELERIAVEKFRGGLGVRRVGLTYVLEITFTTTSAALSSRITNGIADAYMVGELDARFQATRRASRWLQERIQELRIQAQRADEAVQRFKTDNSIVGTTRGLVGDQQLGDVNAQLAAARASTAEAKAKLDRILDIAQKELPDATVADALRNEVITRLRAQYLDLSQRESDWSVRYGPTHSAVQGLRNQMREIKKSIANELARIAETYKSDFEIARAREESLERSLSRLVSQAGDSGQALVRLRDLESSAQTARNLYDIFLQRSMEATQQQTFPITDARVITAASDPLKKSHPKGLLVVGGGALAGLAIGVGLALIKGRLDRTIRDPAELEAITGMLALGIIPVLDKANVGRSTIKSGAPKPSTASIKESFEILNTRFAIDNPFSRAAETIRSIKIEIDRQGLTRETRVIGVTSSVPREGKSTVASNLAQMVAHGGGRTLLIDGDIRNPALSRIFSEGSQYGLIDVLSGKVSEADAVSLDTVTGLHFLPGNLADRSHRSAELIGSREMGQLLTRLRARYEYVFVDLPPVIPVVDVRAAAHLIDGLVFVIEWGGTDKEVVEEALRSSDLIGQRAIGSVLNKAPPGALRRSEAHKGKYFRNYYG